MSMRRANFGMRAGALALAGFFLLVTAAEAAGCGGSIYADYSGSTCGQGNQSGDCQTVMQDLGKMAGDYNTKVTEACNAASTPVTVTGQTNSQGVAGQNYGAGKTAMTNLVNLGKQYQQQAWNDGKKFSAQPNAKDAASLNKMAQAFKPSVDAAAKLTDSPTDLSDSKPAGVAIAASSRLIRDLASDGANRQSAADEFGKAQEKANGNQGNGGPTTNTDKGMDMSSMAAMAAPLASLAAMAMSKSDTNTATGISDSSTATAASIATMSSTALSPLTAATGQSSNQGANSTSTNVATRTNTAANSPVNTGAVSAASKYPDAFTGAGSSGMGSYGGTSNAASGGAGTGASSSGPDRQAASVPSDQKVDEALASFGGGGSLNNLSTSSMPKVDGPAAPDQPVKDFLQDAESNVGNGAGLAANPAQTGVAGEDSLELFHRVHNTLERSQRKGSILMSLGAQG